MERSISAPPKLRGEPTRIVELEVSIASRPAGVLRIGLFDVPAADVFAALAVGELQTDPQDDEASFEDGGVEFCLRPEKVTFSSPPEVQELAFRRRKKLRKTPDDFQPVRLRPGDYSDLGTTLLSDDDASSPGLLVTGSSGPGSRIEFTFLADPTPSQRRRPENIVLGALLDDDSMRLLDRLAHTPVVADRAALGGKACRPIVKVTISRASLLLSRTAR